VSELNVGARNIRLRFSTHDFSELRQLQRLLLKLNLKYLSVPALSVGMENLEIEL